MYFRVALHATMILLIAAAAQAQTPPPSGPGLGAAPPSSGAGLIVGEPPSLPKGADLPEYRAGGGRVLTTVEREEESIRYLYPPLPADSPLPPADPKNFEGAWGKDQVMIARIEWDRDDKPVPFTAKGRSIRDLRVKSAYKDGKPFSNASAECRPPSQPWLFAMYYPFQIFQTNNEVVVLFAFTHATWNIRLNGTHQKTTPRSYMGDSIGHWEGDTLVVDTVNYKHGPWLDVDGTPTSRDAHLSFRIRRINRGSPQLEIAMTVEDPKMYKAPWSVVRTFAWRPDQVTWDEYNCEDQVGSKATGVQIGLVKDPNRD